MEPPITRIESERATVVAITESAHMVMAIVEAGTMTPPIPKPAIAPKTIANSGLFGLMDARPPPNAAIDLSVKTFPDRQCPNGPHLFINTQESSSSSLLCSLKTERSQLITVAPIGVAKPIPSLFNPIERGVGVYTLSNKIGKKLSIE